VQVSELVSAETHWQANSRLFALQTLDKCAQMSDSPGTRCPALSTAAPRAPSTSRISAHQQRHNLVVCRVSG